MAQTQDLRITKTHMALCNAFMELMEAKSFDEITVSELCDKAMVRRATFYKHFADKHDFFCFFILKIQRRFEEECFEEIESSKPYTYFLIMSEKLLDFLNENEKVVNHILEGNLLPNLLDILGEQMMKNATARLLPHSNASPDAIAILSAFYVGGLMQTIRWWLNNKKQISKDQLLEKMKVLLESFSIKNY